MINREAEFPLPQCEKKDDKPILTIGEKVSAKYKSFYNEKTDDIHNAWVGMIEVDGRMVGIWDENSFSGYVESPNRYQALKLARKVRDETKERLMARMHMVGEANP